VVGLDGDEGAVDGGEREARELVGDGVPRVVAERGRYLGPQQIERVPHAWIDDEDGHRRPVKDLVAPGQFLLIAGEDGQAWCDAARQLAAEANLPLDAVRIGHLDGDYYDPRCAWQRHRQIVSDGAVLVRPDRFIAWRHPAGTGDPRGALAAALSQILARPVGRVASPARPRPLSQQPPSGPLAGVPHHPPARP
jgi:2,4-dichlorophenol 6-monooxygenase